MTDSLAPVQPTAAWRWTGIVSRLIVGGLFIFAAYNKIADPNRFADEIWSYEFLPHATHATAIALPWLELFAGAMLVVGLWQREARIIIGGMLVFFTGLKIYAELAGLEISCGCFGNSWLEAAFKGWAGIGLNVGLLVLLWINASAQPRRVAGADDADAPRAQAAPAS